MIRYLNMNLNIGKINQILAYKKKTSFVHLKSILRLSKKFFIIYLWLFHSHRGHCHSIISFLLYVNRGLHFEKVKCCLKSNNFYLWEVLYRKYLIKSIFCFKILIWRDQVDLFKIKRLLDFQYLFQKLIINL